MSVTLETPSNFVNSTNSARDQPALGMRGVNNGVVVIGDSHRRVESHASSDSTEPNTSTKDKGNCSSGSTAGSRPRAACHSPRHARSNCKKQIQRATVAHAAPTSLAPVATPPTSVVATAISDAMNAYELRPKNRTVAGNTRRRHRPQHSPIRDANREVSSAASPRTFVESQPDVIVLHSRDAGSPALVDDGQFQGPPRLVSLETRHLPADIALFSSSWFWRIGGGLFETASAKFLRGLFVFPRFS